MKTAERQESSTGDPAKAAVCLALAEAICSIDEDHKHTEQIEQLLKQAADSVLLDAETSSERSGLFSGVSTVKIDELLTVDPELCNRSPPANYALEVDVSINDYVAEVLASDILASNMGKQALKASYLRHKWFVLPFHSYCYLVGCLLLFEAQQGLAIGTVGLGAQGCLVH